VTIGELRAALAIVPPEHDGNAVVIGYEGMLGTVLRAGLALALYRDDCGVVPQKAYDTVDGEGVPRLVFKIQLDEGY
jgi:hypothetical protein